MIMSDYEQKKLLRELNWRKEHNVCGDN